MFSSAGLSTILHFCSYHVQIGNNVCPVFLGRYELTTSFPSLSHSCPPFLILPVVTFQRNYLHLGVGFCGTPTYITSHECFSPIVFKRQAQADHQCSLLYFRSPVQASTGKTQMLMALMRHKTNSSLSFSVVLFPVVLASGFAQTY